MGTGTYWRVTRVRSPPGTVLGAFQAFSSHPPSPRLREPQWPSQHPILTGREVGLKPSPSPAKPVPISAGLSWGRMGHAFIHSAQRLSTLAAGEDHLRISHDASLPDLCLTPNAPASSRVALAPGSFQGFPRDCSDQAEEPLVAPVWRLQH